MTHYDGFDAKLTQSQRAAVRSIEIVHQEEGRTTVHWRDENGADVVGAAVLTSPLWVDALIAESGFSDITRFMRDFEPLAGGGHIERRSLIQ